MIRWFQARRKVNDHVVVSWSGQTLAYVHARLGGFDGYEIVKAGIEQLGNESEESGDAVHAAGLQTMIRRLGALAGSGLPGARVSIMLRPSQYQLLRIPAPAVPADELRAAARYQVMKMLDTPVDDAAIEVLRVGDGRPQGAGHLVEHLFVVAARRAAIDTLIELSKAMRWSVSVIDIQETAQRNLQSALIGRVEEGRPSQASAALVLSGPFHAMLTICAEGELFYTRRFDLPKGFLPEAWDDARRVDSLQFAAEDDTATRFLLEVQRSLDLWDRIWPNLPIAGILFYAGTCSRQLSGWLSQQLGQSVRPMDVGAMFPGFKCGTVAEEALCLPLLGLLLRPQSPPLE